ncbi:ATP-binding cassette domain-containing protein [Mesobacterium sp. TK19101]|uniref:ATP-binding cassette domain-containing protein n=1 Tax=Mesobacterium hydrothermale TaxID=3111907 RepID=A0ABU6HEJ6_9RHOB|nr:ATP-binding cassette domain-containing protein [Mesobacterium sp. TK19101]MEC3860894.1 ATP-binding cassette domain-containing protein [Mesobacterium sp. TK19101]
MLQLDHVQSDSDGFRLSADLTLPDTGRIAVIGPSGAGKSTLLDLIAGFRAPSAGRIRLNGQDITSLPPARRPVSILFQDNNLFPHLSVGSNLMLALRPRGGRTRPEDHSRIENALHAVGLDQMGNRRPATLSGGQQSRAALARVLIQARPVLLLDEPFSALGPALRAEMLGVVQDVSGKIGGLTIMVTHDPHGARKFADQTVLVADGVAHTPQDTESLFTDPPPALRAYLG